MGYLLHILSFLITILFYSNRKLKNIKKILIIKLDHVGDLIVSTPVISNLKLNFPQARLTVLVGSWNKPLVEDNPYVDEVITYDAITPFYKETTNSQHILQKIKFFIALKHKKFDLIVDLRTTWEGLFFGLIKGGRYRTDVSTVRISQSFSKDKRFTHIVEVNLETLKRIEIPIKTKMLEVFIRDEDRVFIDQYLRKEGVKGGERIFVIHPGAKVLLRQWANERFAQLADEFVKKYGVKIIIVGSKAEGKIAEEVAHKMSASPIIAAGKTTLKQLIALLQRADLFVGNDSGVMHLAIASGKVGVIALFGPEEPKRFGPYGKNAIVIKKDLPCSPCNQLKCIMEGERNCMSLITVTDVLRESERLLSILGTNT